MNKVDKRIKHGFSKRGNIAPEYKIFIGMKTRCLNKKRKEYFHYKKLGIDPIFLSKNGFEVFFQELGKRPSPLHSLDRIDTLKGYLKGNLRWATQKEQVNNSKSNHMITYKGKTQNISAWCEELKISRSTLQNRTRLGWSINHIFEIPAKRGNRYKRYN